MKLLLDQNLSYKLIEHLIGAYPESVHVRSIELESASDKTVWEYAKENDFVLVTQDSDFYNRSLIYGFPPKVIWIQTGNTRTENILELILSSNEAIANFANDTNIGCLELY